MQLLRIGKLEEETHLEDLDQLEKALEKEIVARVLNDNAPQTPSFSSSFFQPAPYRPAYSSYTGRNKTKSKFMQPSERVEVESQPLHPLSYFQKRRRLVAANDTVQARISKFTPKIGSPGHRHVTVDALAALGVVPARMLLELGYFRYAKERKFNSPQRFVKALDEGHEDAEQFLRDHPAALRKKDSTALFGI